ncbi:uncharacterized protein AMSG_04558 [Thecamonas trahens ATCC 50062]|uniref:SH3 domain-containing protein n=1 Tax=Thecamonas trahens ATCC 50062 TaxID=461836 RepID=A0A0L0D7G4_THETB|nr:hypothetical protein AMSG_04558 [Thecamonas trahens ATCC 50062]KNC48327.1 hypothetical protein AMSG_04558 [Thecamonas trahens ATCC 50062]|eukprot:XP_013758894.1 hypothetical protein AMSG_04558 [Thecamonas trahens ATCC 50062]
MGELDSGDFDYNLEALEADLAADRVSGAYRSHHNGTMSASLPELAFPSPPTTPSGTTDGAASTPEQDGPWGPEKIRARRYLALHHAVYLWLERVVRRSGNRLVSSSLFTALHDGLVLTELAYRYAPRRVESRKIVVCPASRADRRNNIKVFLRFCLSLGFKSARLFHVDDLYLRWDMERVVKALAYVGAHLTAKGFAPPFSPRPAEDYIFPAPALRAAVAYLAEVDTHREDLALGRKYLDARERERDRRRKMRAQSPEDAGGLDPAGGDSSVAAAAAEHAERTELELVARATKARLNAAAAAEAEAGGGSGEAKSRRKKKRRQMLRRSETVDTLLSTPLPPPPGPPPTVSVVASSTSFSNAQFPDDVASPQVGQLNDSLGLPLLDFDALTLEPPPRGRRRRGMNRQSTFADIDCGGEVLNLSTSGSIAALDDGGELEETEAPNSAAASETTDSQSQAMDESGSESEGATAELGDDDIGAYVVAMYSFEPRYESQLAMAPGDKFQILEAEAIDGWYSVAQVVAPFGHGYVPVSRVTPIMGFVAGHGSVSDENESPEADSREAEGLPQADAKVAMRSKLQDRLASMGFVHKVAVDPHLEDVFDIRKEIVAYAGELVRPAAGAEPVLEAGADSSAHGSEVSVPSVSDVGSDEPLDASLVVLEGDGGGDVVGNGSLVLLESEDGIVLLDDAELMRRIDDGVGNDSLVLLESESGIVVDDDKLGVDDLLLDSNGELLDDAELMRRIEDMESGDIDLAGLSDLDTDDELGLI